MTIRNEEDHQDLYKKYDGALLALQFQQVYLSFLQHISILETYLPKLSVLQEA